MSPQNFLLAVCVKCVQATLEAHQIWWWEKCRSILMEYDRCCMECVISPYWHNISQQLWIFLTTDVREHLEYVYRNWEMSRDDEPTEICSSCWRDVSIYCMHKRNVWDDVCDNCIENIYD